MSLFPKEDVLKEIESWEDFEYALREENRIFFDKMIEESKREEYANAVNAKGKLFATKSLLMVLIFQQKILHIKESEVKEKLKLIKIVVQRY